MKRLNIKQTLGLLIGTSPIYTTAILWLGKIVGIPDLVEVPSWIILMPPVITLCVLGGFVIVVMIKQL